MRGETFATSHLFYSLSYSVKKPSDMHFRTPTNPPSETFLTHQLTHLPSPLYHTLISLPATPGTTSISLSSKEPLTYHRTSPLHLLAPLLHSNPPHYCQFVLPQAPPASVYPPKNLYSTIEPPPYTFSPLYSTLTHLIIANLYYRRHHQHQLILQRTLERIRIHASPSTQNSRGRVKDA